MSTMEAERPASLRFRVATLILFVAAIGGACGVVVQIMLLADGAIVALLTYQFALKPLVPRM
jgi:hypothetical protein